MCIPDSLSAAIDRLYAVFASVPRPVAIEGCSHCLTEDEAAALLGPTPLGELTAKTLRPYASGVMSTIGEAADFRYFLPRMLEIACTENSAWPDVGVLAGQLRIATWRDWVDEEQAAVRELLHAYWSTLLTSRSSHHRADDVLTGIGNVEDDLTPYLTAWTRAIGDPAAASGLLYQMRFSTRPWNDDDRLTNASWNDHDDQFVRWIGGPELHDAVTAALATATTSENRQTLTDIIELLAIQTQLRS